MAQLISEIKRMQFLAGIINESQLNEEGEKWEEAGSGYSFYRVSIGEEEKNKIKDELGISDNDIKFSYWEDQSDPSFYWGLSIVVNVNALPEDKKSTWKTTINKIVNPDQSRDSKSGQTPPSDPEAPIIKKTGIVDKIKSFFKGKLPS